jgi:hypothetical protein
MNPTTRTPPPDNDRRTPTHILKLARDCLGTIDLDPASDEEANKNVKAKLYYPEDGLILPWSGRVWLNPPGGLVDKDLNQLPAKIRTKGCMSSAAVWWHKLLHHYNAGDVTEALFLCFNLEAMLNTQNVGTGVPIQAFPFCIPEYRIRYPGSAGAKSSSPPGASAIVYLGPDHAKFVSTFRSLGWCT